MDSTKIRPSVPFSLYTGYKEFDDRFQKLRLEGKARYVITGADGMAGYFFDGKHTIFVSPTRIVHDKQ